MMTKQLQIDRDRWLAKVQGQLTFLEAAFSSMKQVDIGEQVLTQMRRAVIVIRRTLRNADTPEVEAFACDFGDLLNLLCNGEAKLTSGIRYLLRSCTRSLMAAVDALERGESGAREVQCVRDELFSVLLVNAVTVKR